jgi:hypothetical protein
MFCDLVDSTALSAQLDPEELRDLRTRLTALPMWQRVDVGSARVAVVHGDVESLAGWGFAQDALKEAAHLAQVRQWFAWAQAGTFLRVPTPASQSSVG